MDEVVELELVDRAGAELSEAVSNVLEERPQLDSVVGGDQLSSGVTVGAVCCTASRVARTGHGERLRLRSKPPVPGQHGERGHGTHALGVPTVGNDVGGGEEGGWSGGGVPPDHRENDERCAGGSEAVGAYGCWSWPVGLRSVSVEPRDEFGLGRRYVPVTQPDPPVGAHDRERPMTGVRTADEAAIRDVLDDSYRAWAAGDADGMVAGYTGDASAIMPGALRDGREVIRDSMAAAFAGPLAGTTTVNEQLSVRFVGTDAAIVLSESGILFPGQSEVPLEGRVNCTWVLEKQDGTWMIAAYHNSPVQV
jgi:uncharacterized protein (TIGR02246 family)